MAVMRRAFPAVAFCLLVSSVAFCQLGAIPPNGAAPGQPGQAGNVPGGQVNGQTGGGQLNGQPGQFGGGFGRGGGGQIDLTVLSQRLGGTIRHVVIQPDGSVVVATGTRLIKYDKDLNFLKQVEVPDDVPARPPRSARFGPPAEGNTLLQAVLEAQKKYWADHGTYALKPEELGVDAKDNKTFTSFRIVSINPGGFVASTTGTGDAADTTVTLTYGKTADGAESVSFGTTVAGR
jgi:hypothetical protein